VKPAPVRFSAASIAVFVIQLGLVSSVAGKYLYQRWTCPRVWTRTAAFDPERLMRGRYLSLQLTVDGCQSTLPSAKQAQFPRDFNGVPQGFTYSIDERHFAEFPAVITASHGKLVAVQAPEILDRRSTQQVIAQSGVSCDQMRLVKPVNFYIAEHAKSPLPLAAGAELWIEVTVPPKGPPRPIQLALKQNGVWEPLAFQ
jgi:uncharacterized membrane-anchored protein